MDAVPDCSVCLQQFGSGQEQRPRSLPGGHSLCHTCLVRLLRSSASQACPTCRHPLSNDDLTAYPSNFDLLQTIENLQQLHEVIPNQIPPEDLQLDDEVIGRGAYGIVRCGVLRVRGVPLQVAVKLLSVHGASDPQLRQAEQEIDNISYAARACPLIVRVFGHCIKDQQLCLVMPRYHGSLLNLVQGAMTRQQAHHIALQLAKAVQQLHSIRMLHLDIKPQNVLVDQHGDIVLSDLGVAHQMKTLTHFLPSSAGSIGTPNYMSPEAVQPNVTPLKESADVWSLAATILYIYSKQMPYHDLNTVQIIAALQARKKPDIPATLPDGLRRLLCQCFAFRAHRRPTAAQVVAALQTMAPVPRKPVVYDDDQAVMKCAEGAFIGSLIAAAAASAGVVGAAIAVIAAS